MARYSKEHRDRTRAHLLEIAREQFRQHGFDTLSIDRLTAAAGLTRGAFYVHFDSKEALVEEVLQIESGLLRNLRAALTAERPREAAADAFDAYLSNERAGLIQCPLVAHPMDSLRGGEGRASFYSRHVEDLVAVTASVLGESRDAAVALITHAVGAASLGASVDPELSSRIRVAARSRIREMLLQS